MTKVRDGNGLNEIRERGCKKIKEDRERSEKERKHWREETEKMSRERGGRNNWKKDGDTLGEKRKRRMK